MWMQIHSRSKRWQPVTLDGPASALELPDFGLRCIVGDLYRRTPLDPGRPAARER